MKAFQSRRSCEVRNLCSFGFEIPAFAGMTVGGNLQNANTLKLTGLVAGNPVRMNGNIGADT